MALKSHLLSQTFWTLAEDHRIGTAQTMISGNTYKTYNLQKYSFLCVNISQHDTVWGEFTYFLTINVSMNGSDSASFCFFYTKSNCLLPDNTVINTIQIDLRFLTTIISNCVKVRETSKFVTDAQG